ncbi:MAG TPA: RsmE family RNA methyltransferase [Patescibacteria group bacterium]|nr:RsmE family RNA methyltransferase [Patescibacteria group bacterium]
MKQHRFIIPFSVNGDRISVDDPDAVHQMRDVLQLKSGEVVLLGNGGGDEVEAEIRSYGKTGIHLLQKRVYQNQNESSRQVVLFCSLLKRENFEWVVQKATEVGISCIVPVVCSRTVKLGLKMDRLRLIAKEAAEQSGRARIPLVQDLLPFDRALALAQENDRNYFFDLNGMLFHPGMNSAERTIGLFIGPEGGWEDRERANAEKAGGQIVSLGKLTLRAETAAVIASYLLSV